MDLLSKDSNNGAWTIAELELRGEWIRKKIQFGSVFVRLQGIIENRLKIGGGGRRAGGRHDGGC